MTRILALSLTFLLPAAALAEVAFKEVGKTLEISVGGKPFTVYRYGNEDGASKPFFWPVNGPFGEPITRQYPNVKDAPDKLEGHPHQRGLHFTHGEVAYAGKPFADFWAEPASKGKHPLGTVVHTGFDPAPAVTGGVLEFGSKCRWNGPDGAAMLTEHTRWRIADLGGGAAMISAVITLTAGESEVRFLDTKEGSFAIRVSAELNEAKGKADKRERTGQIANSEGKTGEKECWGKPADWVDYSGAVGGKTVGVAIFDHPDNKPRVRWHVRAYGLFAANPFGQKGFDAKQPVSELPLVPGKPLTLRYGVLIHAGDAAEGKVADRFKEYLQSAK